MSAHSSGQHIRILGGALLVAALMGPRHAAASEPLVPPELPVEPPERSKTDQRGRDIVFVADDPNAELKMRDGRRWRSICLGSCKAHVPTGAAYFVGGEGLTNSSPFKLHSGAEPLRLRVVAGSSERRAVGTGVIIAGGVVMGIGGLLLVSTMGYRAEHDPPTREEMEAREELRNRGRAGAVVLLAGIPVVLCGIWVSVTSKTRLHFSGDESASLRSLKLGRGFDLMPTGIRF